MYIVSTYILHVCLHIYRYCTSGLPPTTSCNCPAPKITLHRLNFSSRTSRRLSPLAKPSRRQPFDNQLSANRPIPFEIGDNTSTFSDREHTHTITICTSLTLPPRIQGEHFSCQPVLTSCSRPAQPLSLEICAASLRIALQHRNHGFVAAVPPSPTSLACPAQPY